MSWRFRHLQKLAMLLRTPWCDRWAKLCVLEAITTTRSNCTISLLRSLEFVGNGYMWTSLTRSWEEKGDFDRALTLSRERLNKNMSSTWAWRDLGYGYLENGDCD